MLEYVRSRLSGRTQAEWREVADAAGVPYATLEKIAYGVTQHPRVSTLEPLYTRLKDEEAAIRGTAAQRVA